MAQATRLRARWSCPTVSTPGRYRSWRCVVSHNSLRIDVRFALTHAPCWYEQDERSRSRAGLAVPCVHRRHARCSLRAQRGRLFRTKVMTPMMARVPMPVVEVRLANGHRYRAWPAEWRLCQGPNGTSGSVLLAEGPGVYVLVDCSEIVGFRPVLPARFAPPHHQLEARNFHASGTARRARDARDPRG